MNIDNLDFKRGQLLNKYRDLFVRKTGFTGSLLENYVNNLIATGEKYYGANFTDDILREKREDSILWLIDDISRNGNYNYASNNVARELPAGNAATTNLENALSGNAPKGLPDGERGKEAVDNLMRTINGEVPKGLPETSESSKIIALIEKMNEQELIDYLGKVIKADQYGKFNGFVSEFKRANPNLSDFEAHKKALIAIAPEIELIDPITQNVLAEKQDAKDIETIKTGNVRPTREALDAVLPTIELDAKQDTEVMEPVTNVVSNKPEKEFRVVKNFGDYVPVSKTARAGKRKEAPKGLISKFKEKWRDSKFKKKMLVGAIAIGVIGLGVIAATAISQMISSQSIDTNMIMNANHLTSSLLNGLGLDSISDSVVSGNEYMDYTVNAGDTIYSNAADATLGQNGDVASQWYSDKPQGIYDTANNQWVDTSNIDFNNPEDMKQFMDGDHALLQGGEDHDGFIKITEDMIKTK